MSGLSKISEALSRLPGDSPVARALSSVAAAQKSDGTDVLLAEVSKRLADITKQREAGTSAADLAPLVQSTAGLLSLAAGTTGGEIRVMSKSEFEQYAVEAITKAAEGIEAQDLAVLQISLDAAQVMFAGDNIAKSFALPVLVAKTEAAPVVEEATEVAPVDATAKAEGEEGEPAPVEAGAEGAAPAAGEEGDKPAAEAAGAESTETTNDATTETGDDGDRTDTAKCLAWPSDMNSSSFLAGKEDSADSLAFGVDVSAKQ